MNRGQFIILIAAVYTVSALGAFVLLAGGRNLHPSEEELGLACISGAYPAITRGVIRDKTVPEQDMGGTEIGQEPYELSEQPMEQEPAEPPAADPEPESQAKPQPAVIASKNEDAPLIIIYHTHATESYQPVSEGNFHTQQEAGSVREVGSALASELERMGYLVVHDKTIYDAESYNQSYSRSLEGLKTIMAVSKKPAAIIDLHRDAAAYTGNVGKTVLINGENVASYALVVGKGNSNAAALGSFAAAINDTAEDMYKGFGGRTIDKAYKYNQSVSDRCILLEIGNNENNIREAVACGKYFAKVLDAVLQDRV